MTAAMNETLKSPHILLMAGGTGGRIFPALAVADYLRNLGWQTSWLGSEGGMEESIVPRHDIPIYSLTVRGVRGKSLWQRLLSPVMLAHSVWQALRIIQRLKPDVVLGMGGFASGPGGIATRLLGRALCIHEQNAVAGMTNRWLSRVANYCLEAFPNSLAKADEHVGNPVRKVIIDLPEPGQRYADHQGPLRILIVGGSRGAAILNQVVPEAIAEIITQQKVSVWHQTGAGNRGVVHERYSETEVIASLGDAVRVTEFIDDMAEAYSWADLVICRSGALTVAELAAAGLASILVPFPHAVDDHQTLNARYLSDADGAELLPQERLNPQSLASRVLAMGGREGCVLMAENAFKRRKTEATERLAEYCARAAGVTLNRRAA